tara:strand:- start:63 stop:233 length:171 start_codon:yes stop_codon:yes gene_type:complete
VRRRDHRDPPIERFDPTGTYSFNGVGETNLDGLGGQSGNVEDNVGVTALLEFLIDG